MAVITRLAGSAGARPGGKTVLGHPPVAVGGALTRARAPLDATEQLHLDAVLTRTRRTWADRLAGHEAALAPEAATGFAARVGTEFDTERLRTLADLPRRLRVRAASGLGAIGEEIVGAARDYEGLATEIGLFNTAKRASDDIVALIAHDRTAYDRLRDEGLAMLATAPLSDGARALLGERFEAELAHSYAAAHIDDDPAEAHAVLTTADATQRPSPYDALSDEQRQRYSARALTEGARRRAAAHRAESVRSGSANEDGDIGAPILHEPIAHGPILPLLDPLGADRLIDEHPMLAGQQEVGRALLRASIAELRSAGASAADIRTFLSDSDRELRKRSRTAGLPFAAPIALGGLLASLGIALEFQQRGTSGGTSGPTDYSTLRRKIEIARAVLDVFVAFQAGLGSGSLNAGGSDENRDPTEPDRSGRRRSSGRRPSPTTAVELAGQVSPHPDDPEPGKNKLPTELLWLFRRAIRELERVTEQKMTKEQRSLLANLLRERNFLEKASDQEYREQRRLHKNRAAGTRRNYENNTGNEWTIDEFEKRDQIHHPLPLRYGGPYGWPNVFPVGASKHQKLLHGVNSVLRMIFDTYGTDASRSGSGDDG
jgi:hypothetical protein